MYRVWNFITNYSILLICGALLALVWANLDAQSYHHFVEYVLIDDFFIGHAHAGRLLIGLLEGYNMVDDDPDDYAYDNAQPGQIALLAFLFARPRVPVNQLWVNPKALKQWRETQTRNMAMQNLKPDKRGAAPTMGMQSMTYRSTDHFVYSEKSLTLVMVGNLYSSLKNSALAP